MKTATARKPASPSPPLPQLTALQLEAEISVPEAARLKGISEDTFKRNFAHLIRRPSPRRITVKLRDAIS